MKNTIVNGVFGILLMSASNVSASFAADKLQDTIQQQSFDCEAQALPSHTYKIAPLKFDPQMFSEVQILSLKENGKRDLLEKNDLQHASVCAQKDQIISCRIGVVSYHPIYYFFNFEMSLSDFKNNDIISGTLNVVEVNSESGTDSSKLLKGGPVLYECQILKDAKAKKVNAKTKLK